MLKLLADVGDACALYQDRVMSNLPCRRIQVGEVGSFGRHEAEERQGHRRGCWWRVYTHAIDPDTKLMPCWLLGQRNVTCIEDFMDDLAPRLAHRNQADQRRV